MIRRASRSIRKARRTVIWCVALATCVQFGIPAGAAGTPHGTVTVAKKLSWKFPPVGGPSGDTATFDLTVKLPQTTARLYHPDVRTGTRYAAVLVIKLTWKANNNDTSLGLSATNKKGNSVGNDTLALTNSGGNVNEFMLQMPRSAKYTIQAFNWNGNSSEAVPSVAVAKLILVNLARRPQPREPSGGPLFSNYHIPLALMPPTPEEQALGGRVFGEPSIGVDPRTNALMYQAGLYTIRGKFVRSGRQTHARWRNVSDDPLTNSFSEDAILWVDRFTGRTWVSQLDLMCSIGAYSDNDGTNWTPAAKSCQTPPAVDHQTIGSGPFAQPIPSATYPHAVYYCSQNVSYAACGLSLDGGNSYGAASPMFTSAECFGIHGHVKVAPDGAVYVPDKACGAPECLITSTTAGPYCHPGYAVSTDNGGTWTVHNVGGHSRYFNSGDPSIGIGARGTMYFGYGGRDGRPYVAVCRNDGATCGHPTVVGRRFHIRSVEMPQVVAGDDKRAAFAFLGSTTPGDDQQYAFRGTWHLYVAVTYDRGKHWTTVDATPHHPMQRGCIEFDGNCPRARGVNDQRNLLDFNDLTIDKFGFILAAYTDGCYPDLGPPGHHGTCRKDATRLSGLGPEIEGPAVARQWCGRGLYRRYDRLAVRCP